MADRVFGVCLVLLGLALQSPARADCKLTSTTLPVTMLGMRPLLPAKINGTDALFLVDSGAVFSLITPANASRFHLPLGPVPFGMTINGVTGAASAQVGTVNVFTLAATPISRLSFIITGGELGEGAAGAIGQNVLGGFDVDYDLAHGSVRLLQPHNCGAASLAYWAGDKPVSTLALETAEDTAKPHHALTTVYLNGVRLRALLDTGAAHSIISLAAASRAGVTPRDVGVTVAGRTGGVGQRTIPVWRGLFQSFKIGGEEVRNSKMLFGELQLADGDMLLGADFFLSHHVLISNSQQKVYVTYNGGPVFMANVKPREVWGDVGAAAPQETPQDPTDATGLALRGAASASRRDYPAAIADLSKAVALAPGTADYLYERGRAYLGARQPFRAMEDFDHVLTIKPDDIGVLVLRAQLKLRGQDRAGAILDLDAAGAAAAKQDDVHLRLGQLYEAANVLPSAVGQYDMWLEFHPEANEMPVALTGRCRSRALLGQDLDQAMADCNQALRLSPGSAPTLDSRGLIRLRRGDLEGAVRDYDAALAANPTLGRSLYGRGLAKRRLGDAAGSGADLSSALTINPKLAEEFSRLGLAS